MGKQEMSVTELNGQSIFRDNLNRCNMLPVMQLVARCAVFCPVGVYETFKAENGTFLLAPDAQRRRLNDPKGKHNGIRYDDNTYPNTRLKALLKRHCGVTFANGTFNLCHVWQEAAYEQEYFSAIPNLVLMPCELTHLVDCAREIGDLLAYRAYELYGWYPETMLPPAKPEYYEQISWFSLPKLDYTAKCADSVAKNDLKTRVQLWARQTNSLVHRVIRLLLDHGGAMELEALCAGLQDYSRNPLWTVERLCADKGNHYGKVLEMDAGTVRILEKYLPAMTRLWENAKKRELRAAENGIEEEQKNNI